MHKMEEYRLFMDYIEKMIERRGAITTIYLSVNAAIIGGVAFVFKDLQVTEWGRQLAGLAFFILGIISCAIWRRLLRQYSMLLNWWYGQMRSLESEIPDSSKLLTKEFQELYAPGKESISLTQHELRLTWVFAGGYLLFGVVLIGLLFSH